MKGSWAARLTLKDRTEVVKEQRIRIGNSGTSAASASCTGNGRRGRSKTPQKHQNVQFAAVRQPSPSTSFQLAKESFRDKYPSERKVQKHRSASPHHSADINNNHSQLYGFRQRDSISSTRIYDARCYGIQASCQTDKMLDTNRQRPLTRTVRYKPPDGCAVCRTIYVPTPGCQQCTDDLNSSLSRNMFRAEAVDNSSTAARNGFPTHRENVEHFRHISPIDDGRSRETRNYSSGVWNNSASQTQRDNIQHLRLLDNNGSLDTKTYRPDRKYRKSHRDVLWRQQDKRLRDVADSIAATNFRQDRYHSPTRTATSYATTGRPTFGNQHGDILRAKSTFTDRDDKYTSPAVTTTSCRTIDVYRQCNNSPQEKSTFHVKTLPTEFSQTATGYDNKHYVALLTEMSRISTEFDRSKSPGRSLPTTEYCTPTIGNDCRTDSNTSLLASTQRTTRYDHRHRGVLDNGISPARFYVTAAESDAEQRCVSYLPVKPPGTLSLNHQGPSSVSTDTENHIRSLTQLSGVACFESEDHHRCKYTDPTHMSGTPTDRLNRRNYTDPIQMSGTAILNDHQNAVDQRPDRSRDCRTKLCETAIKCDATARHDYSTQAKFSGTTISHDEVSNQLSRVHIELEPTKQTVSVHDHGTSTALKYQLPAPAATVTSPQLHADIFHDSSQTVEYNRASHRLLGSLPQKYLEDLLIGVALNDSEDNEHAFTKSTVDKPTPTSHRSRDVPVYNDRRFTSNTVDKSTPTQHTDRDVTVYNDNHFTNSAVDKSSLTRHSARDVTSSFQSRSVCGSRVVPVGLSNNGFRCYFNAVLQNINQTFVLESELHRSYYDSSTMTATLNQKCPMIAAMLQFYNEMKTCSLRSGVVGSRDISYFFNQLASRSRRFQSGRQQDSHEALRHLMDAVKDEEKACNSITKYHATDGPYRHLTVVDKVFGGHFLTIFQCHHCGMPYHLFEPFLDLSLPVAWQSECDDQGSQCYNHRTVGLTIATNSDGKYKDAVSQIQSRLATITDNNCRPDSVQDSLRFYTRQEQLDKYLCLSCNTGDDTLRKGTKQTLIYNPPAILTIHLKRFEQTSRGYVKVDRHISFEKTLDLAPFCSKYAPRCQLNQRLIKYELYGIVVHSGSLDGGHYIACVKTRRVIISEATKFLQTEFIDRDVLMEKTELIKLVNTFYQRSRTLQFVPNPVEQSCDDSWYEISDSSVHRVSEQEVLRKQAYLLFYERVG